MRSWIGMVSLLCAFSINADVVTLLDSTNSFNKLTLAAGGWSNALNASNTLSGGVAHMLSGGTTSGRRAFIYRNNGDTLDQYNGASVYNFYDHALSMEMSIANLGGALTSGGTRRISYFLGIAYNATPALMTPGLAANSGDVGVFFSVDMDSGSSSYAISVWDGGTNRTILGYMSEVPVTMDVLLNGNSWDFTVNGTNTFNGTFSNMSSTQFSDYYLCAGANNLAAIDTAVSMDILSLKVTTPVPEPASVALFLTAAAGILFSRRFNRKG